jgi:hypothetical protein
LLLKLQQIVFKRATDEPLKPNAGLRPATLFVAGLLGTFCKFGVLQLWGSSTFGRTRIIKTLFALQSPPILVNLGDWGI